MRFLSKIYFPYMHVNINICTDLYFQIVVANGKVVLPYVALRRAGERGVGVGKGG